MNAGTPGKCCAVRARTFKHEGVWYADYDESRKGDTHAGCPLCFALGCFHPSNSPSKYGPHCSRRHSIRLYTQSLCYCC